MDRLQAMEMFVRVVESGSFSAAAAEFATTQPTVTKQVANIEGRLGVRLLNRNTRGISVTESGALYYERCKVVLREAQEAENLFGISQDPAQGLIRVGSSVSFGRRVVTPLVLEFMHHHPRLRVDLTFEDRYTDLVAQGIDVALRLGKLADSSLGARHLGTNPWLLVASPRYLERAGVPARPADLVHHEALIYSSVQGNDVWRILSPHGEAESVQVTARLRSNNLSSLVAAANKGYGIAGLPWYATVQLLESGKLVQVLRGFSLPEQEIHAVFPSPKLVPAKVQAFIAFLHERFGNRWWEAVPSTEEARR